MSVQKDGTTTETAKPQETAGPPLARIHNFRESWEKTSNYKSLNSFQRFTTLHLLNLRFLEDELATVESQILQAGLKLSEREEGPPEIEFERAEISPDVCDSSRKVSQEFVLKLRMLVSQYDEALIAFNSIKGMETILLNAPRPYLAGLEERYNGPWVEEMLYNRLVKPQSSNTEDNDIIRRSLRKLFVHISIFFRPTPQASRPTTENIPAEQGAEKASAKPISTTDPLRIGNSKAVNIPVEFFTRLILALVSGALLIAPLAILSFQSTRKAHLVTVAVSTVVFSLLVSLISKSSNAEIMAAAAGYTAVLVVFFAVAPQAYS